MFSLSEFQSNGHSQYLFHVKNIQKMSPSIQTLMDEFQKKGFRKGGVGMSSSISMLIELLPFLVTPDSKIRSTTKISQFLRINGLFQVKSCRMTR